MTGLRAVDIEPPNYLKPAAMLRQIADDIDAGTWTDVATIAVALQSDEGVQLFGGGRDSGHQFCAYLFAAAAHKLHSIPFEEE